MRVGGSITDELTGVARRLWRRGLDLLFPPACVGCGRPGEIWCRRCDRRREPLRRPRCERCFARCAPGLGCRACHGYPPLLQVRNCFRYRAPVSRALLHLKYRPNRSLAEVLAGWLVGSVARAGWAPDLITAVPLGRARQRQRGFNQAGLLAEACAASLSVGYGPELLERVRETSSQVGLDAQQRDENVRDAFDASVQVNGMAVLVVDDLYTTGATMRACARALLGAGARRVYGVTVARAGTPRH